MPGNRNRDEFTDRIKTQIAKRAGWLCSYPSCRALTVGGEINLGTAAHIIGAVESDRSPRGDANMSSAERRSASNGIWMCRNHGKAIDDKDPEFTIERLREWKKLAEDDARRRVLQNEASRGPLPIAVGQPADRLRAAAEADLSVFRRTTKWPSSAVALTLEVEGFGQPATTTALARVVTSLDDLILVAGPGTGKTTTLFQIAQALIADAGGTPIIIPLADWATQTLSLLGSILTRQGFQAISEDDFRAVAAKPGVVLLLDGWNELSPDGRTRARVQVDRLMAELPELGFIVSTRKHALDVPFVGMRVDLLPLNQKQQTQIAAAMRGEAGLRIVDQAWRTPGVRELVTIPLYLTALLSLPEGAPFPTTKEELLRHFVTVHETDARRAETLRDVVHGFQQDHLECLAVFATRTQNTSIADTNARRTVSQTQATLIGDGQITIPSQPDDVLDVLASNHVLIRTGGTLGYSFQHQQFQEWYASHSVERRTTAAADDPRSREALKAEVFNLPIWEEAILFAVERMARSDAHQQAVCGKAILSAFEVDPILAAEMIFRATEEVWAPIAPTIRGLVARWHTPGKVDRALRFMLASGRPEFLDAVWPLITHEDDQTSLKALRNCSRFRPSILGSDAVTRICGLSAKVRTVLLHEMASNSGIDGLDLATAIASDDPATEVQVSTVEALAFRGADRHVADVLRYAGDETIDLVARNRFVHNVPDERVKERLAAAREREIATGVSDYDRLHSIVYSDFAEDRALELADFIGSMETEGRDAAVHLVYEARQRYPRAVASGLLTRVRTGRTLFYGADDILAAACFSLEDDALLELALMDATRPHDRGEAAASALGPLAVGRMIEALNEARARLNVDGTYDQAASDRYHTLLRRLAHARGASLVAAIHARSLQADNDQMARLAGLLSRHPSGEGDHGRPFDADSRATIQAIAQEWGDRMLASGTAKRWQTASIATLASQAPSIALLPLLRRLLDDNLRHYRAFRAEAQAAGGRAHSEAATEAITPHTNEYQHAFLSIDAPETAALMREYLIDDHFGEAAAHVLAARWQKANDPPNSRRVFGGPDFSRVEEKRAARAANPSATSVEAETIFAALEPLIADGVPEERKKLGLALGVVASRLPHGQRDATVQSLIAIAPRRLRAALLLNQVLSGHIVDIGVVKTGLAEVMEAGRTQSWILSDGYEVSEWLRLLPFTNFPAEALTVVQTLPEEQRRPDRLEEMIRAFGEAPGVDAENALFAFAEACPAFYDSHVWRDAVTRRRTLSAARRFVDLAAGGSFADGNLDRWHMAGHIGELFDAHPALRAHVYGFLSNGASTPGLAMLAEAVVENPDAEGVLLLLSFEGGWRSLISRRAIGRVVTQHVPSENLKGAFTIVPVPAVELREKLLALTTDGGALDAAARCLNQVDRIWDEYGSPEAGPRHPDLASGRPWPIMTPDPDAGSL